MSVDAWQGRVELRKGLVDRLVAEAPRDVLDVGCGAGALLSALRDAGVAAAGLEHDADDVAACRRAGLRVVRGHAERLPFARGAFDWVVLRHVLHHLALPVAAVSEAARVARTGLLLAEPWRDPADARSDLGTRLDAWLRRQDRRRGRVHADDISPHGLVELLPDGRWSVRHASLVASSPPPFDALVHDLDEGLAGLPSDHDDRRERDALLAEARAGGLPAPGSALLVARRR